MCLFQIDGDIPENKIIPYNLIVPTVAAIVPTLAAHILRENINKFYIHATNTVTGSDSGSSLGRLAPVLYVQRILEVPESKVLMT